MSNSLVFTKYSAYYNALKKVCYARKILYKFIFQRF